MTFWQRVLTSAHTAGAAIAFLLAMFVIALLTLAIVQNWAVYG